MRLYLVRHGESDPAGFDDQRTLNEKGKEDVTRLAKFISHLKLQVTYIFQSQKLRAQQTAKILSASISSTNEIETRIELDPLAPISNIIDEITALNEDIMLVGHMPFMGNLASQLIANNENKDVIAFNTGSMVCLEKIASDLWVIRWMLSPELLGSSA